MEKIKTVYIRCPPNLRSALFYWKVPSLFELSYKSSLIIINPDHFTHTQPQSVDKVYFLENFCYKIMGLSKNPFKYPQIVVEFAEHYISISADMHNACINFSRHIRVYYITLYMLALHCSHIKERLSLCASVLYLTAYNS